MNTWINLTALWKIIVIGLAAGAGLPAVFAFGLRALNPSSAPTLAEPGAEGAAIPAPRQNPVGVVIAAVCFAAVLAAVGWGIYSIVNGS